MRVWVHRVPTAQGKQGKWQKKIPVRENTGNLEILLAQVVNSLILKVKDIAIFAANISIFSRSWIDLPSQFCISNSHKLYKLTQEKFVV